MLETLTAVESLTWASILSKMLLYLTSLVAAGTVLFLLLFGKSAVARRKPVRRLAVGAAAAAALFSLLLVHLRAAFLGGGTLEAALDTALIALVIDSQLGISSGVRLTGLLLILLLVVDRPQTRWTALGGALMVAFSFTFVGHSLNSPRPALATLLTLHVLAAAFWIGALGPLHRIAGTGPSDQAGALIMRFGRIAVWVVGTLLAAGLVLAALLVGGIGPLVASDYGQLLLTKMGLVAGLGMLAAYNKLTLSPAVASGSISAARKLQFSIRLEWFIAVMVLFVTATFTSISSPDRITMHQQVLRPFQDTAMHTDFDDTGNQLTRALRRSRQI